MNFLLRSFIQKLIKKGNLYIKAADGLTYQFGDGSGSPVRIVVNKKETERKIACNPSLGFPEAYMKEEVNFEEGDIFDLVSIFFKNDQKENQLISYKTLEYIRAACSRLYQINTIARAKHNISHHYDLGSEFYSLFLDEDMQYSCALFENPTMSLEEAQAAKKQHIAKKLLIKPKAKILDIGSGWGGLGLYLAKEFEADILGITLSEPQKNFAMERVKGTNLEKKVRFEVRDYRNIDEQFDRIVSVGMFEHVGISYYKTFFHKVKNILVDDGVMLLHTIARTGNPMPTHPFIRKYIFPGGYIPSISEVSCAIEQSGLIVNDMEILRLHYANTLEHWRKRFAANREKVKNIYNESFCRMWELYLASSEAGFRWHDFVVLQVQLTKRNDILPITRDYIYKRKK